MSQAVPPRMYVDAYRAAVPHENWIPHRTVRVPDELWAEVKRVAADRDETVTSVIIRSLERYVRQHPLPDDED